MQAAGGVDPDVALAARFDTHIRRAAERSAEILARYRDGVDPQAIARELGLDTRAVKQLVQARRTSGDRSARARALAARHTPRFSAEELLAGLGCVASRLGRAPSGAEYDRLARELELASLATVVIRFGAWRTALSAAGLTAVASSGRVYAPRWSAAACRRALESVADQLGSPPRYSRYVQLAAERDDLPSGATVRQKLGLWIEIASSLRVPAGARRARSGLAVAA